MAKYVSVFSIKKKSHRLKFTLRGSLIDYRNLPCFSHSVSNIRLHIESYFTVRQNIFIMVIDGWPMASIMSIRLGLFQASSRCFLIGARCHVIAGHFKMGRCSVWRPIESNDQMDNILNQTCAKHSVVLLFLFLPTSLQ